MIWISDLCFGQLKMSEELFVWAFWVIPYCITLIVRLASEFLHPFLLLFPHVLHNTLHSTSVFGTWDLETDTHGKVQLNQWLGSTRWPQIQTNPFNSCWIFFFFNLKLILLLSKIPWNKYHENFFFSKTQPNGHILKIHSQISHKF